MGGRASVMPARAPTPGRIMASVIDARAREIFWRVRQNTPRIRRRAAIWNQLRDSKAATRRSPLPNASRARQALRVARAPAPLVLDPTRRQLAWPPSSLRAWPACGRSPCTEVRSPPAFAATVPLPPMVTSFPWSCAKLSRGTRAVRPANDFIGPCSRIRYGKGFGSKFAAPPDGSSRTSADRIAPRSRPSSRRLALVSSV